MTALEIRVHWGETLFRVEHLEPRDYTIGRGRYGDVPDFVLPHTLIEAQKHVFVAVTRGVVRVFPPGGAPRKLALGERIHVPLGPLRLEVALVPREARARRTLRWSGALAVAIVASFAAHAALLAGTGAAMPPLGDTLDTASADADLDTVVYSFSGVDAELELELMPASGHDGSGIRRGSRRTGAAARRRRDLAA